MIKHETRSSTISVLLPVYNAESYLLAAMESVLKQTYRDFELLVLNDGSTDNSLAILKKFAAQDKRIRIISRENKGLVETLNELVSEAKGEYLARMDADDICLPERFAKQIAFMNANPGHVVIGSWVETINAKGQPIGLIKSPVHHADIDQCNLRGLSSIWHPTAMIRKKAMLKIAGYKSRNKSAEDLDLWLRLAEIGKLANIPQVLLKYRLHENATSEASGKLQQENARHACEQAWQRRNIKGHYEPSEHWRPGADKASRHKFALKYGWIAWRNLNRETWWTYACQALRMKPFALSSWRLMIAGLLKSPRDHE
jgi:glycosyltransferase involved in cell wall biosynthesis